MKYLEKLFNKVETASDDDLEIEIFNFSSEMFDNIFYNKLVVRYI